MCVQKHPCKYKCYQNYMALYRQFPIMPNNNNQNNECWCKPAKENCGCFKNLFYQPQQNNCLNKNKYSFCLQGTIKFDGFC